MPLFTYKCPKCNFIIDTIHKDSVEGIKCPNCFIGKMTRTINFVPNVIIGSSFNSDDIGKVLKEKNEYLKKKNESYSEDHQSLMKKTQKKVDKLLKGK